MTTPQDPKRIRRQRNLVLGLLLGGFVVLVYFISIAKMT
jgi:hypothetical protein